MREERWKETFMPVFVPGLELSRRFFHELVCPLLTGAFPGLCYAAALLGPGSEVLSFDTELSVDHDWGPCLLILRLFPLFMIDRFLLFTRNNALKLSSNKLSIRESSALR